MSAPIRLEFDDGSVCEVNFESLLQLVREKKINAKLAYKISGEHFPQELAEHEARRRYMRWDACFSNENSLLARQTAVSDQERLVFGSLKRRNEHDRLISIISSESGPRKVTGNPNHISTFAKWVYSVDHLNNRASQEEGREVERLVRQKKRVRPPIARSDKWELVFEDDDKQQVNGEMASALKVNGQPMFGKPDYVFLNDEEYTALIIEIKTSNADLYWDAWPNLRAQLWAYGHLDFVLESARHVILIGEVWTKDPYSNSAQHRRTYRWDMDKGEFGQQNEELFSLYQRKCEQERQV